LVEFSEVYANPWIVFGLSRNEVNEPFLNYFPVPQRASRWFTSACASRAYAPRWFECTRATRKVRLGTRSCRLQVKMPFCSAR